MDPGNQHEEVLSLSDTQTEPVQTSSYQRLKSWNGQYIASVSGREDDRYIRAHSRENTFFLQGFMQASASQKSEQQDFNKVFILFIFLCGQSVSIKNNQGKQNQGHIPSQSKQPVTS